MNPEDLKEAYKLSARPYLEASCAVDWSKYIHMRSWRYVLEISSACNLHCTLCHAGNREGYEYKPGIMDMELFEKILDKIQSENPTATVCAYVNSEPFLHPKLAECITSIKRRGLKCEIATNGNIIRNIDEVMAAKPDLFTVSVSGWTQEVYERAHKGGNIETVRENIKLLAEASKKHGVLMGVSYHIYSDNQGDELAKTKAFTESLGLMFLTSYGRVITMENTIQALRHLEKEKTGSVRPYPIGRDGLDLNKMLPPAKPEFLKAMERLMFNPEKCTELYSKWPIAPVCLIADVFTEIRHDGRVQLCAWTDDMRMTLGNYLEMTQEQISAARRGHPLCQECLRYRMNLYYHLVDREHWT